MTILTICDPRHYDGAPVPLDYEPRMHNGCFMYWRGELREVREIHRTANGRQIELF
jgi:hypothetical protein